MIYPLLLQNVTVSQPTPYAVYATLAVGVLSLIASGLNIFFSSKTAQKVVNLSTKTTREVAELSAQVSREAAGLASETARELKEKDYKNDFYKKILEKRLNAWVDAEQLFFPMRGDIIIERDGKSSFFFFHDKDNFNNVLVRVNKVTMSHIVWLDKDCIDAVSQFRNKLLEISNKIMLEHDGIMDADKLLESGLNNFKDLVLIHDKILVSFAAQLSTIHEIEVFLEKRARGVV